MLNRRCEHFGSSRKTEFTESVSCIPPHLYRQHRDWTCSVACLRSITSMYGGIGTENEIVSRCKMTHGPYYARELEACGLLDKFDYEITSDIPDVWNDLHRIYNLLKSGASIMVESCKSYDHWLVLLAYFPNGKKYTEDHQVLLYDPYYNETFLVRASQFCDEWLSGDWANNGVFCDFIAIKGIK